MRNKYLLHESYMIIIYLKKKNYFLRIFFKIFFQVISFNESFVSLKFYVFSFHFFLDELILKHNYISQNTFCHAKIRLNTMQDLQSQGKYTAKSFM